MCVPSHEQAPPPPKDPCSAIIQYAWQVYSNGCLTSYACPLPGLSLMTPTTPTAAPVVICAMASWYPGTLPASATICRPASVDPSLTSMKLKVFCDRIVRTQPLMVTSLPMLAGLSVPITSFTLRRGGSLLGSTRPTE